MKKILFALITSATALGGISAAQAAEPGTAYIGAGVVASQHKYNLSNDTSNGDRKSDEWSGKIYGGYQIDKTWAVEGGYTDFGSSNYKYSVGTNNGAIDSKSHSFYVAGKGSYPINDQLSAFGKLGVAYNKNDVHGTGLAAPYAVGDSNRTNLYASVGAEYAINQKVSLSLEYEHYGKNDIDQGRKKGAVTLGARYNF
ncbi:flagellar motor protein MotB [Massilia sp. Root418]|uniref:outer membrane beta-barrel protein n=1 Tax=Massilia sp. Root418 TaxID=1736532 RepID=UPI0006F7A531|nr:outer membrane beta-barrel protein [Massilia sp. Root418]KQW90085.1 flagellar motor protein MotB [Massilia sp. Root418]